MDKDRPVERSFVVDEQQDDDRVDSSELDVDWCVEIAKGANGQANDCGDKDSDLWSGHRKLRSWTATHDGDARERCNTDYQTR